MGAKWAFQLLPNTPGILGKGYRVDPETQAIEDEVDAVLQCKFNFHGINKLVIRLGPKEGQKDYEEHDNVAQVNYPDFSAHSYNELSPSEKADLMKGIILEVFGWLSTNFEDAQCFDKAQEKLGWP